MRRVRRGTRPQSLDHACRRAGALCLACADLDHLLFLPAGDTAVTRRARKHSTLAAVVLKWSQARKRYERQGLLVEAQALERAEKECLADEEGRARQRQRQAEYRAATRPTIRRAVCSPCAGALPALPGRKRNGYCGTRLPEIQRTGRPDGVRQEPRRRGRRSGCNSPHPSRGNAVRSALAAILGPA